MASDSDAERVLAERATYRVQGAEAERGAAEEGARGSGLARGGEVGERQARGSEQGRGATASILERRLLACDARYAEQLAALSASLEREAHAHAQVQAEWDTHKSEVEEARAEAARLRREVDGLERALKRSASGGSDGDGEGEGGADGGALHGQAAAMSWLTSPQQLRQEVISQRACIGAMDEALAAAEARVRELERWRDLAADAGLELG